MFCLSDSKVGGQSPDTYYINITRYLLLYYYINTLSRQELLVYYETIKRELYRRLTYECRCDERLQDKAERFTRLAYTGLRGGLEHLKIETRLIDERFASVKGECVIVTLKIEGAQIHYVVSGVLAIAHKFTM